MDTKRHLVLFLIVVTVVSSFFTTSCRVGEEDPFFSMRTRKARLTGEWVVDSYLSVIERRELGIDSVMLTTTEILDEVNWRQLIEIVNTPRSYEYRGDVFRHRYRFDGNGRMTSYYNYEIFHDVYLEADDMNIITITNIKEEVTGTWNFLGGIDDYKNKERLAVVIEDQKTVTTVTEMIMRPGEEGVPETTVTQSVNNNKYENGEMSTIYKIRMLRNNQMILDQDINTFTIIRDELGNSWSRTDIGYMTMTLNKL